jgi:hypothetical protein
MKTDTLDRRLRWESPNHRVKRVSLTDADYLVFGAIDRHGPLPTNLIYEFTKHLRKDYTHLQNRLTEFYNGDEQGPFLVRPPQQFAGFEARYQHLVYNLAPRARLALAECGTLVSNSPKRTDPFLHQLMGACVSASLELSAPAKGIRYIGRNEILTHDRCPQARKGASNPMAVQLPGGNTLIPDDLFGIEYPDVGFRFFAVEIDRNTESIERKNMDQNAFGRKVAGYLTVLRDRLYQSHWGLPNLSVLTVTTNATHARNILDYIDRQQAETRFKERFAFNFEPSFGANWRVPKTALTNLLNELWTTVSGTKDISSP